MTLSVNTNMGALRSLRQLRLGGRGRIQSLERLSSGLRINNGRDDPSGLLLSEKLRSNIAGLKQGIENLQRGIGMSNTAESGVGDITNLLIKLQSIILEASQGNIVAPAQKDALQREVDSIISAVDRLASTTRYDDRQLLNGEIRKTARALEQTGLTGVSEIFVPAFSNIQSGIHKLELQKIASVLSIDASGVVGEGGLITDEAGADVQPLFSPNGDRIVYVDAAGDIINRNARDTHIPVTAPDSIVISGGGETGEDRPQFTPDGASIVYEADTGGPDQIYRRNSDGTGGATLIGSLSPNTNPSLPMTGPNLFAYDSPYPNGLVTASYAAPGGGNITGLTQGSGGNLLALSDADDTVYEINAATGAPTGFSIALGAGSYSGIAYNAGADEVYVLEQVANPGPDLVHVYDGTTGLPTGPVSFAVGTQASSAPIAPPNPSTGDPGVLTETVGPTVVNSALAPNAERITLTFTSTPTSGSPNPTFDIAGTVSGAITSGTFMSGTPITVNGIQFTLTGSPTAGDSVSGLPPVTSLTRSHLFASIDGAAPVEVQFPAGFPPGSGAAIAAVLDSVSGMGAAFDGTNYTLTSDFSGTNSGIVITGSASSGSLVSAGGATSLGPGEEFLTINVDGAGPVVYDLSMGGGLPLTTSGEIVTAINTVVPGVTASYVGGNYQIVSSSSGSTSSVVVGGAAGTAGDLLDLRGVDGATAVNGFDDAAAQLNLGAANGGTETGGTGVQSGDTYQFDITAVGDNPTGITYDGANLRLTDQTRDRFYRYSTAGAFDTGYAVPNPQGIGEAAAYNGGSGTFFTSDSGGNLWEVNATTGAVVQVLQNPSANNTNFGLAYDGASLYVSNTTDNRIYVMDPTSAHGSTIFQQNADGTGNTQVSGEPGSEINPDFAGNGSKIAYQGASGEIFVRNPDGTGRVTISAGGSSNPRLSHDGSFVAYENGGTLFIARTSNGAVTDSVIGSNAQFSPNGTTMMYEAGGSLVVAETDGAGNITGTTFSIAGATNGQFSLSNSGNRITYEQGGNVFVRFADGSQVTPLRQNDGTTLTGVQLFSTQPTIQPTNTIIDEDFILTLTTDNDGNDIWSVMGTASGLHNPYTQGSGLYTTNDTAGGGGGLSFEIAQDGQFAVGDVIRLTSGQVTGASLDGGPFQLLEARQTTQVLSGKGGTLDIRGHAFIPSPVFSTDILVEDGITFQGGFGKADSIAMSVENYSSTFLGIDNLRLFDNEVVEVAETRLFASNLLLTQSPTVTTNASSTREELMLVEFTSSSTFSVRGSVTGLKSSNNTFTSGTPFQIDGVEMTLNGTAATGDSLTYRVSNVDPLNDIHQAIDKITSSQGELGSIIKEIEKTIDSKSVGMEQNTVSLTSVKDVGMAEEVSNMLRNQILESSAMGSMSHALASHAALLTLLA